MIVVATSPKVELGEYKGIKVKPLSARVTKKDVDAAVKQVLDTKVENMVKETPAEKGDTVVIDFKGYIDDVAFEGGEGKDYSLEIGSGTFIDNFEDQLIGAKAGDAIFFIADELKTAQKIANKVDDNLSVGVITESNLTFTDFTVVDGSTALKFEPLTTDVDGDVRYDGTSGESLSFTFSVKLSPVEYLDEIQIKLSFTEGLVNAHKAGYIVLPTYNTAGEAQNLTILKMDASGDKYTPTNQPGIEVITTSTSITDSDFVFTVKVTILWGEAFDNTNPGISLDADSTLTPEAKKFELFKFKGTIYGMSVTDAEFKDADYRKSVFDKVDTLQYSLTLTATVN